ncbi:MULTISPECIES: ABC transporter substrate-binding protein [unclassified Rhizobium]|uniref:ABC transporter substrate-binding protein n=1 Tax=unclassified Rhizobium TaxID=2613769 RepID=UPI001FFE1D0F|nr:MULTISPECIES: ABC transporter substrate-binding protein [unclassified Rhizobium]
MNLSPKNSPARTVFGATLPYPHQFREAAIRQFGAASAPVYAIDKDGITQGILDGLNKPLAQMVTPAHFDWSDSVSGLEYDLDGATALIAAAGKPLKLHLTTGAFFEQRVAEAMLQELQDLGFDVDMVQVDTPPFCSLSRRGRQMAPPSPSARPPAHARTPTTPSPHSSTPAAAGQSRKGRKSAAWSTRLARPQTTSAASPTRKKVSNWIAKGIPTGPLYQMVAIYGAARPLNFKPTPTESFSINRMSGDG